jgi:hypothetical protein
MASPELIPKRASLRRVIRRDRLRWPACLC